MSLTQLPVTANSAPHWPHIQMYEFGQLGALGQWEVPSLVSSKNSIFRYSEYLEQVRKDSACNFRMKVRDKMRINIRLRL